MVMPVGPPPPTPRVRVIDREGIIFVETNQYGTWTAVSSECPSKAAGGIVAQRLEAMLDEVRAECRAKQTKTIAIDPETLSTVLGTLFGSTPRNELRFLALIQGLAQNPNITQGDEVMSQATEGMNVLMNNLQFDPEE